MVAKDLVSCIAVLAWTFSPAAVAQDTMTAEPPSSESAIGARVEGAASGFVLVSHGVWSIPAQGEPWRSTPAPKSDATATPLPTHTRPDRAAVARRQAFLGHVTAAETQFGLQTGLLDALVWTESRFNPLSVSPAGAVGLASLCPQQQGIMGPRTAWIR